MKADISYSNRGGIKIFENKIHVPLITVDTSRNPVKTIPLLFDTGAFITLIGKKTAIRNGYEIYQQKGCIISGFSEKGIVCDLRKISSVVFCGFLIEDVFIATPHDDEVKVTENLI